jgi:hypothetical protein
VRKRKTFWNLGNPGNFASLKKITDFSDNLNKISNFFLKKTKIFEGSFEELRRKLQSFSKEASKNFEGSFKETSKEAAKKTWREVFEFLSSDIKMTHHLQSHLMRKTETSHQSRSFSFTKHNVQ